MNMTQRFKSKTLLVAAGISMLFAAAVHGDGPKKLGPNPVKCPNELVCKVPARGVDYPVCHDGVMPPICNKQSDCAKLGLSDKTCIKVAPMLSLCVQACTP
jgi:hypothetical protein